MLWIAVSCAPSPDSAAVSLETASPCAPSLTLSLEENPASPLAPLASIDASQPFRVRFEAQDVTPRWTRDEHVIGLRAETTYTLSAWTEDACSDAVEWTTGALPGEVPTYQVSVPWEGPDDGAIVVAGPVLPSDPATAPWLLGFDRAGEVVYVVSLDANGRSRDLILDGDRFWVPTSAHLHELDASGRSVGEIELSVGDTHHDVVRTEDGFLVMLEVVQRQHVDGYGEVDVVGDRVVEVGLDGEVLWSWSSFDHLPVEGFDADLVASRLEALGQLGYTHANSMALDGDTVVLSLRHQHAVIGVDRATGEIAWRVDGDTVQPPFAAPHDASRSGDLLQVFDNLGGATSRATIYDLTTGDAVWSHDVGSRHETFGSIEPFEAGDHLVTAVGQRSGGSPGTLSQVTPEGAIVWQLEGFSQRWIYRARPLERLVEPE